MRSSRSLEEEEVVLDEFATRSNMDHSHPSQSIFSASMCLISYLSIMVSRRLEEMSKNVWRPSRRDGWSLGLSYALEPPPECSVSTENVSVSPSADPSASHENFQLSSKAFSCMFACRLAQFVGIASNVYKRTLGAVIFIAIEREMRVARANEHTSTWIDPDTLPPPRRGW